MNSYALVTGASAGIGLAYCYELASRGYNLIMVSNEHEKLNRESAVISERYAVNSVPMCKDLSLECAAGELNEFCREQGLEVDILINNAGIFYFKDVTDISERTTATMIMLHIYTVTKLCRYFGEKMKLRKRGYILNMSSMSSSMPFPGIAVYSATKAYIRNFSEALYYEMRDFGVGVTVISPGAIATDLYKLSERNKKLGVSLGILMPPDVMVKRSIKAMFCRKRHFVPGFINHIFIFVIRFMPSMVVMKVRRLLIMKGI